MHRIEIFLRTIDEINRNETLLPNITLGCDIRDSCWYPPVALEQSIDFIKNSIASLENIDRTESKDAASSCSQSRGSPIAGLIGPGSSTVTVQVCTYQVTFCQYAVMGLALAVVGCNELKQAHSHDGDSLSEKKQKIFSSDSL